MALKYGFFNSVDGDRVYNADSMSSYFKGLVSDGVYESVGDAMVVTAGSGMAVNVGTGRCLIDCKWAELDAIQSVAITAASATLNRWTAVIVRMDATARTMAITTKDGTPAATPTKPAMTNTETVKEICLAYIYVKKGVTTISQSAITDTRADSTVCGWVTGLIKQVNTSTLFLQWQTAYQEFYNAFQSWFDTLTSQLQVNTYITAFEKRVSGTPADCREITLDMTGYTYDAADIITVYINGLRAARSEWQVSAGGVVTIEEGALGASASVNSVIVEVLKSKIGDPVSAGGNTFAPLTITDTDTVNSSFTVSDPT